MESDRVAGMTRRVFMEAMAAAGVAATVTVPPGHAADVTGAATAARVPIIINGQRHDLVLDPRVTLLDLLRERLELTGTKKGCDHGQCGACTVLVNGRRVNACLTLAIALEGDRVVTVEGLARGDDLHPVQQAFLEHDERMRSSTPGLRATTSPAEWSGASRWRCTSIRSSTSGWGGW